MLDILEWSENGSVTHTRARLLAGSTAKRWITWRDPLGNVIDFVAAPHTFLLELANRRDPQTVVVTKSVGVTGLATDPNVCVDPSGDISQLASGTFIGQLSATLVAAPNSVQRMPISFEIGPVVGLDWPVAGVGATSGIADVDLSGAVLDLTLAEAMDISLPLHFSIDLTGYGGWVAVAKPDPESLTQKAFTVDTSQQASRIITLTMAGALADGIESGWVWSLHTTAPTLRTLIHGDLTVVEV